MSNNYEAGQVRYMGRDVVEIVEVHAARNQAVVEGLSRSGTVPLSTLGRQLTQQEIRAVQQNGVIGAQVSSGLPTRTIGGFTRASVVAETVRRAMPAPEPMTTRAVAVGQPGLSGTTPVAAPAAPGPTSAPVAAEGPAFATAPDAFGVPAAPPDGTLASLEPGAAVDEGHAADGPETPPRAPESGSELAAASRAPESGSELAAASRAPESGSEVAAASVEGVAADGPPESPAGGPVAPPRAPESGSELAAAGAPVADPRAHEVESEPAQAQAENLEPAATELGVTTAAADPAPHPTGAPEDVLLATRAVTVGPPQQRVESEQGVTVTPPVERPVQRPIVNAGDRALINNRSNSPGTTATLAAPALRDEPVE